jgi:hypothetical protein
MVFPHGSESLYVYQLYLFRTFEVPILIVNRAVGKLALVPLILDYNIVLAVIKIFVVP